MTYVKTYLPTLKMHVVNLKRDAKDLSRDLQRLEVRGKLGSKTLYYVASLSLCGLLIKCRQPAKSLAAWRSELSSFGGKWVNRGSESFKLPSALDCQATYLDILAVYLKT